jgi:hypothetical protein
MPDVVSVRQTRSLPPASFRFLIAKDTLALGYVLGTINPHLGLSPIRLRPCWAHKKWRFNLYRLKLPLNNKYIISKDDFVMLLSQI